MATTDFVVKNGLVVTENAVINETTDASDKDTGALVVEGGVGIEKKLYVGTDLSVGGATTLIGDLAVNGGDLTTSSTTATVFNTTATTVNIAGAATDVQIGAATGTTEINNSLNVVGDVDIDGGDLTVSTSTFNLANTTATTVNFAGAATDVQIGAATGTTNVNNNLVVDLDLEVKGGDLTTNQSTFNLINTTATTVNFAGAATDVQIGAATGTTEINNNLNVVGDVDIDGGDLTVSASTFNLANTTATTVNFAGAATDVQIGAATGTTNINNSLDVDGDVNIDGGDLTVSTGTFNLANTTATIVNFAGAGTTISIGAATGTTTINNANTVVTGDLAVNGADITTTSTGTATVFNANATTLNMGQAATTVSIGATTGTTTVRNSLAINGDTTIGDASGDTITVNSSTASVPNTLTFTVDDVVTNNIAYPVKISHTTSGTPANGIGTGIQFITETTAANNEIGMLIEAAVTDVTATSEDFDFVVKLMAAGAVAAERFRVNSVGNVTIVGDLAVNGGDITSSAISFNLLNSTVTTLNIGGAATTVEIGAATGTTSVNNALTVDGNTVLGDSTADTVTVTATVLPGVVISGTTTGNALRITQLGTGNALVVEDETNPDSSPFVIDNEGRILAGQTVSYLFYDYAGSSRRPKFQFSGTSLTDSMFTVANWASLSASPASLNLAKSKSGTVGTQTIVANNDDIGVVEFSADDGTNFIPAASILAEVDGTPGTNDMPGRLVFSTTADGASSPTERMRIGSAGDVGIGTTSIGTSSRFRVLSNLNDTATTYNIIYGDGTHTLTADNAVSFNAVGSLANLNQNGFNATISLTSGGNLKGFNTRSYVTGASGTVTSAVGTYSDVRNTGAGTLTNAVGFQAIFANSGGGTLTNTYGVYIGASTAGTNNFGFHSNIASGTGRWNFYAAGTADNYFAGNVGIGTTAPAGKLDVAGDIISQTSLDNTGSFWFQTKKSRGTVAAPTTVLNGDTIGGLLAVAYQSSYGGYAAIQFKVNGTVSTNTVPTDISFFAAATGAPNAGSERMRIASTGIISLGAGAGAESLRITPVTSAVNYWNATGNTAGNGIGLSAQGSDTNISLGISSKGTGSSDFYSNNYGSLQFRVAHTASAVNYLQVTGAATGSVPVLQNVGSDTNIPLTIATKGTGYFNFQSGGGTQFLITNTASAVNYLQATGAAAGTGATLLAAGSDTNINIRLAPKGTGTVQELYNGTYYDIVSQFDIGTNPNQIPLNQYLGTMAYQNAEAVTIGTLAVTGATSLGTGFANYLSVGGASSTNPVTITTLGSDTNVGLTITTKGTGAIIVGNGSAGVDVKGGSTGFRVWDTNSTHYYQFVTGDRSANYNINLPAGDVTLVAGTMITSSGGTFTGQIISTLANNTADGGGQIYLNGATGNRIDFNTNGTGIPAFTTRSVGTKIVLYPNIGAAAVDYAFGIESGNLWSSVPDTTNGFKWYGGTTLGATLTGAGALTLTNNLTVSGGTITTGNVAATVLGGNTTTNIALGGNLTSGTFTLGGTATTGTMTIDQSNSAHTLNIASGTNASGVTKTVNIGTNGASGSTTNINIGSAVSGALGSTYIANNVGIGASSPAAKLHIVGNQQLIRFATTATESSLMNANTTNSVIGISAPFGGSPATTPNAGAKWGITFTGNGDNPTLIGTVKSASIFAISEDVAAGYNRSVGLSFFTSAFDLNQAERMRIASTGTISLGAAPGAESLRVTPVASAVNFVEVLGGATGTGGRIFAAGSDSNIALEYITKGTNPHTFYTGASSAIQFRIANTVSAVNYLTTTGQATGGSPQIFAAGSDANVGINLATKGTGGYGFFTNTFAQQQFSIVHTASAVNYLQVTGSETGNRTAFSAQGSDTNVGINYNTKGAEFHVFTTSTGAAQFVIAPTASAVNQVYATGGTTGNGPTFSAQGPDTNIGITLTPKGTGGVAIGATSAGGYKLYVNGSFAATTKSFVIDHPTKPNMKLRYGSLEGPENGVYVRGRLQDSNTIELPDYWTGLVDPDSITVNLTPIGSDQGLYVSDVVDNTVIVGGENVHCFYTVFAERKDVDKLEVEIE